MDISGLTQYFNIVIVGICLCTGYVVKTSTNIKNKYIPAIACIEGLVLAIAVNYQAISLEVILMGMISGLASTGLYEAFRNFIGVDKETK